MQIEVKFNLTTVREGPEGEEKCSSGLPLTSALDGVVGQRNTPAASPPGILDVL
jgi:hypothetical protein